MTQKEVDIRPNKLQLKEDLASTKCNTEKIGKWPKSCNLDSKKEV
jgi:hypothetical protein